MASWTFRQPNFEHQPLLNDNVDTFGWLGHIHFAYDLVSQSKPETVVELGTHWGVSFFSFSQAAKDHSPSTKLYAVDTWQGEEHAGFYDDKVIKFVKKVKANFFPSLAIHLVRKTFDQAAADFADQSIDILHIDGLHTYEAVKHDFETWLPKVKPDGLILFHDTTEKGHGFGVYRFWRELTKKYPMHFEFPHSHGLGVICLNEKFWKQTETKRELWAAHYAATGAAELARIELFKNRLELKNIQELLAQTREALNGVVAHNKQLTKTLEETVTHAQNLEATIANIQSSKTYKLAHGLGKIKRKVTGRS